MTTKNIGYRENVYTQTQIDPVVSFRNALGEPARGTIINVQRKSLVMEVYNPYSIVQVSEVLSDVTVRMGAKSAYFGKAVVVSMVNTGLTAIVSLALTDEWRELTDLRAMPKVVGDQAKVFVQDWGNRFQIRRDYQIIVNEMRAFLSEVSRWVEQVDLTESLPKEAGRLREDFFYELAEPLMLQIKSYVTRLEGEALQVDEEFAAAHRSYAQAALHPLMLRAPFIFRTYTKPLGYAGDYIVVRQMLDDPRQGASTYFQIVNATFLQSAAVVAHRNRISILVEFLKKTADAARAAGRPFRVLNVGCGPVYEIQRFIETYPEPELLSFELVDFNAETLTWARGELDRILGHVGKKVEINYVHDSVHELLKRQLDPQSFGIPFDVVYCAGLFDYLSDRVCARLLNHFATRTISGGKILVTNVHPNNPERVFGMEHVLEWYLIYRDEAKMTSLLPERSINRKVHADATGVNVFAEATIP